MNEIWELGTNREVLWDMEFADKISNITLQMHKPIRKNIALECDAPWEGRGSVYGSLFLDGGQYRLYYRARGSHAGLEHEKDGEHAFWCLALSDDGKTFYKPNLGLFEFNGSKDNNIILKENRPILIDDFSVQIDTNPNCPPDARYKALSSETLKWEENGETVQKQILHYYKSADGLHFERVSQLNIKAMFDSMNLVMWDSEIGKYRMYLRNFHHADPALKIEYEAENVVRDVRLSLSEDFEHWTEPQPLDYGDDKLEIQFYTNNVSKYYRANIFFGIPTRYIDRSPDKQNYKYLPDWDGTRPMITEKFGREGTAITEAMLMTSRDGLHFHRTNEAFFSPGLENGNNWLYGDGYFVTGLAETTSDFPGEPNELSLYTKVVAGKPTRSFVRFTVRMDGFFSWHANFAGGEVLTRPFTFSGNRLTANFASSALGYLQITLCDEDGNPIDGYCTGRLFGNSICRPCDFEKPLSDLAGKTVRMHIAMKDCEFYSFTFEE